MRNVLWVLIGLWALPALAQDVTITADGPTRQPIVIAEGVRVTITAMGQNDVDAVLTLLDEQGRVVAYNDDHIVDGMITRDARIVYEQSGNYTLLIDSFNGVTEGTVALTVVETAIEQPLLTDGTPQTVDLRRFEVVSLRFETEEATTLQLTVRDLSSTLDPVVRVVDSTGQVVVLADDAALPSDMLNLFDVDITLTLPAGEHLLILSDWLGRAGTLEWIATKTE